tara:strand:+ start:173 stop:1183 length:1011 start_codon:yes stop_codon:yes gene_type:complete
MARQPHRMLHLIAIYLAMIVVCLGAYTRLKHAGLGCPDWPKCFENWIVHANITSPALSYEASEKAWIEMIHRYAAGILGIIVFMLRANTPKKETHTILNIACVMIIIQALFGMWTVTWRLHPLAVMPHLIGGMTITTLLCVDYQKKFITRQSMVIPPQVYTSLQILWVAVFIQIVIGGWTSANYAALVCPDFPKCQGQWFIPVDSLIQGFSWPFGFQSYEGGVISGEGRIAIHMTHRWGALICTVLVARLSWQVIQLKMQLPKVFVQWFRVLTSCFAIQITLGILNVRWQLPISIAVGHNIVALALLITVSVLLHIAAHHKILNSKITEYYQHATI